MKKYSIASLAGLALITLASCQKEGIQTPDLMTDAELVNMEFAATTENDDTKSLIDETNAKVINWNRKDSISVFEVDSDGSYGYKFVNRNDSTATQSAVFSGKTPVSGNGYYALYPYKSLGSSYGFIDADNDGTAETIRLKWNGFQQEFTWGSFDPNKGYMVAKTTSTEITKLTELKFYHVFSFIKFSITFPCTSVTFRSNNGEILACSDVDIKFDADGYPVVKEYDGIAPQRSESVMLYNTSSHALQPGTYYMPVLPVTLENGFTIEIGGSVLGGSGVQKSTTKSVNLQRAHVLNLGELKISDFYSTSQDFVGDGTETSPYMISTLDQLYLFAEKVNDGTLSDKCFALANDIDCGGKVLSVIGNSNSRPFTGIFNGNGYTVSNFIVGTVNGSTGFFGYTRNATIKNLKLAPNSVEYSDGNDSAHGMSALIGVSYTNKGNWSTVDNCHVTGVRGKTSFEITVGDVDSHVGGIVGISYGQIKITNCSNSLDYKIYSSQKGVYAKHDKCIGGILGEMFNYETDEYCIINKCRNEAFLDIQGCNDVDAGGILGKDGESWTHNVITRITNCVFTNEGRINVNFGWSETDIVSFLDANVGGIIGYHNSDGTYDQKPFIYNCVNAAYSLHAMQVNIRMGGIMGYCENDDTQVYNCASTTALIQSYNRLDSSDWECAGICGNRYGWFHYCHWVGTATTESIVPSGGIWGTTEYSQQENCSSETSISADMMEANRANIPGSTENYSNWTTTDGNLDLHLGF